MLPLYFYAKNKHKSRGLRECHRESRASGSIINKRISFFNSIMAKLQKIILLNCICIWRYTDRMIRYVVFRTLSAGNLLSDIGKVREPVAVSTQNRQ